MAERKIKKIADRFNKAGFNDELYVKVMLAVESALDGKIDKIVEEMDRDEFDSFFNEVILPVSARIVSDEIRYNPQKTEKLARSQTNLAKSAEKWDIERFRNTIGRKPVKKVVDGKEVSSPSPIGKISDQDYIALVDAGLSDEDIEMYLDKFRKEDQKRIIDEQLRIGRERDREERRVAARDFTDNMFPFYPDDGILKRAGKIIGNTAVGTGVDVFLPELKAEAEDAIANGRDARWGRALAKDFGFNSALALTPYGVGKYVAKKGLNGIKNLGANFLGNMIGFTAGNYSRQLASDYYRPNLINALKAATVGATIPATFTGALYGINKLIPAARRYTMPALRKSRGIDEGPEVEEVESFETAAENVYNVLNRDYRKTPEWDRNIMMMVADENALRVAERLSGITGVSYNLETVKNMLSSKNGLLSVKKILQAPTRKEFGMADMDSRRRMEENFPGTVREMKNELTPVSGGAKAVNGLSRLTEDFGGVIEPIREIGNWERRPSDSLSRFIESSPETVRQWGLRESPIIPEGQKGLYEEWVAKFRRDRR